MNAATHPHPENNIRRNRRSTPARALSVAGSLAISVGGLMTVSSVIASPANATPLACGVPSGTGLQQNINTDQGCDVIAGTSLMSGYISDSGLAAGQQVTLEDAYEGLSSHNFYSGSYTLTLNCSSGSANPAVSTYVIEQGTGSYPSTPPTKSSGTLPVVTADSHGNIVCGWSMTVQNPPIGHLNSSKSDLWIVAGGSGNTATTSVKPPVLDGPTVPTIPTVPTTTNDPTTVPSDPTTVPSDPTTVPSDPTTVPSDPTTVPSDPTTVPSVPTTSSVTTLPPLPPAANNTDDPTTSTTVTAPPLQTQTVSDPSNSHTFVYDPHNTTTSDPGSASVPASPVTPAAPSAPSTFNPHGLSALAFTGSISEELAVIGLMLIVAGGLIVGFGRRYLGTRP